jgi:toxin-antitoxin system PIN domain toxin
MKSYFPDLNVWIALTYRGHQQHAVAASWFGRLQSEAAGFCRVTQLGFLRLLTHPVVMGDEVRNRREAWETYDLLISDSRVTFYSERDPDAVESEFRVLTATNRFAPQQWPDAYLVAFAKAEGLILVTFDRALSKLAGGGGMVLLK